MAGIGRNASDEFDRDYDPAIVVHSKFSVKTNVLLTEDSSLTKGLTTLHHQLNPA